MFKFIISIYFLIGFIYYLTDRIGRRKKFNKIIDSVANKHSNMDRKLINLMGEISMMIFDILLWPKWFIYDVHDLINEKKEN